MNYQIFFLLTIFYGTIFGQLVKDDSVPQPRAATSDLIKAYNEACNRSLVEADKLKCAGLVPKPSNVTFHIVEEQNNVILESLVHSFIHNEPIPEFQPIHGFQLLAKTLEIYKKLCPEVTKFLDRVEYLFKVLHYRFASTRSEYLIDNEKQVNWIKSILETCLTESEPMHFLMDTCKDLILGVKGGKTTYICTKFDEEANPTLYDPIMDSIWSIINAIRAGCFHNFHGSYLMWHHYFLALIDTFGPNVQLRWNAQLEGRQFWTAVLGPRYRIDLANMEKCTRAIVDDSDLAPFPIPIGRGQFVPYVRMMGTE